VKVGLIGWVSVCFNKYSKEYLRLLNNKNISDKDLRPDFMSLGRDGYVLKKKLFKLQDNGVVIFEHPVESEAIEHSHDFFEMLFVDTGRVKQIVNNESFTLEEGSLCFYNKEVVHSISKLNKDTKLMVVAVDENLFDLNFFKSTVEDSLFSKYIYNSLHNTREKKGFMITEKVKSEVVQILSLLNKETNNKHSLYKEVVRNYLPIMFINLFRSMADNKTILKIYGQTYKQEQVILIYDYLKSNFKIASLTSAADELHLHPNYLCRLIKNLTGKTFTELQQNIRIEIALNMLSHTDATIDNISSEIGYENPNHFYRVFKEHYGVTPNSYRQKLLRYIPKDSGPK
jgi:YesN/AraC family two-component response regulator